MTTEPLEILVPTSGVVRFLDERFGASGDPVVVSRLGEGHSNLTFRVSRGSDEWVLRRPPRGEILPSTHDMSREFRVMSALVRGDTGVPVPRPIELCTDEGYIGAPFYLMARVDGLVVRERMPAVFDTARHRRAIGLDLADTLAAIHSVDWRGVGLDTFSRRPEEFLARNAGRMQQLYEMVRHRDLPDVDEAGEWLRANMPIQRETTLTHGDYKLDNVMLSTDSPPRVVAVVDWEISAIGDPMVDLGWMLYFSRESGDPDSGLGTAVTEAAGYPTRARLASRYAETSGRELADLRFYVAYAGWKIAIIMEGSYRRWLEGMADDPMFESLDVVVPALARRCVDVIRGDVAVE